MGFLSRATAGDDDEENTLLKRLSSSQIFMICIGGTIGIGFAKSSGEIIAIAGPGGALLAFVLVGFVAICVMEGVCEMINLWPISNGMIEFVRNFVDEDLAMVVGFTYWYAYCCSLAALVIGAGSILTYFNLNNVLLNVVYIAALAIIFIINLCGVFWFGVTEFYGGILKLMILLGVFVLMMCINGGVSLDHQAFGSTAFVDGVRNNPNVATSHFAAVLIAISLAIFPYIGVELVTVTAFEAADPKKLRWPTKNIAYVITLIYGLIVGALGANVEWFDSNLPQLYSQSLVDSNNSSLDVLGHQPLVDQTLARGTTLAPVIAALEAGASYKPVASVILGFLVYSALSCAGTALYVASRTLYGLTRDLALDGGSFFERLFAHLNQITPTFRVPLWSLIMSLILCASWLPFVKLGLNQQDLFQIMSSIGSIGVLLVWASQCLAFIQYHKWLAMHKHALIGNHARFQRWPTMRRGFSSYAAAIQPVPAYIGLISCLIIVFIFNSAQMWNGNQVATKALNVYLGPAISLLLFLILKLVRWRRQGSGGWVELGDWNKLHSTLDRLDELVIRRNATLDYAPTFAVSAKPSIDETGNGQPAYPGYAGGHQGQTSVSSDGISPPQDYSNSQRRGSRMSIPLSEIGPGDTDTIAEQRRHGSVSADTRTTPFNPQAAYLPPQATHYAPHTQSEAPSSAYYPTPMSETSPTAYYTPQSTMPYAPPSQQHSYEPYQPY